MPWQQHVADVVLEIDPETGRLAYSEFGLEVPRQSGKSTFILAKSVHRASATKFFGRRQRIVYTAQTRGKAREKWEEDYAQDLEASRAFGPKVKVSKGNGNEHIRFPNGSRFGIESNTEKAGHGGTLDEAYIDEAFAQVDGRLEQAFRPAMITRPNTQLGWISTAGWLDGSPYLEAKTTRGRAAVEAGKRSGVAYFEWSAPEDADPADPAVWRACMPALGHTIDERDIRAELDSMEEPDFRRAYLNQWVPKGAAAEPVIAPAVWAQAIDLASAPVDPLVFALDVEPDRGRSSIAVAGRNAAGRVHVEVVDEREGTEWVPGRIAELVARYDPAAVVIDKRSAAAALLMDLAALGIAPELTSWQDMTRACGAFYDLATQTGRLAHLGQRELTEALASAKKRRLGEAWAWSRAGDAGISALVAATLATHGLAVFGVPRKPAPPPRSAAPLDRAPSSETNHLATAGF